MADDRKSNKKDSMRPWKIGAVVFVLLLVFLVTFASITSNQGGGWIEITLMDIIESFFDKGRQSRLDKRHAREIVRLEALGGPEESEGLLEIAFSPYTNYENLLAAFSALGDGRRQEDVPVIIERSGWYRNFVPRNNHLISAALGEIGGEEACRALNHKFLKDAEGRAYSRIRKPFDLKALVKAVRTGLCLTEEEVRQRLERFARDPWVTEKLQRPSLELLAVEGDQHATAMVRRIEQLRHVLKLSTEEHIRLIRDLELPVYIRSKYLEGFARRTGRKDQLLDLFLSVVAQWYADMPDVVLTEQSSMRPYFKTYGRTIFYSTTSSWESIPKTFFDDWAEKIPDLLPEARAKMMLDLLQDMESSYVRNYARWKNTQRN